MINQRRMRSFALVFVSVLALLFQFSPRLLGQYSILPGDVVVGDSNSRIGIYRFSDAGITYVGSILTSNTLVYYVQGLCFSTRQTYLFAISQYGTVSSRITEFSGSGQRLDEIWGSTGNLTNLSQIPMCCSPDADGNIYVGTSGFGNGQANVIEYDADGNPLRTFQPPLAANYYRSIEIAQDQKTLYYIDGQLIKRYDLQTGSSMPDFAEVPLPEGSCWQVRLRRGGEVFAVASNAIIRYSGDGSMIRGYEASYYLLDRPQQYRNVPFISAGFSIDNKSLWALFGQSGISSARIVKLDIETGQIIDFKDVEQYFCLSVAGEPTAARTQCSDGIDNDGDGKVDYPDDSGCTSNADTLEPTCGILFGRVVCLYKLMLPLYVLLGIAVVGGGWWLIRKKRAQA